MKRVHVLLAPLVLALSGCGDLLVSHNDPPNDALSNFDQVWTDFDLLYAFFSEKNIDWGSARALYRARITPATGQRELFIMLTEMLGQLRDGHVSINAQSLGTWGYNGWHQGRPANFAESVALSYVTSVKSAGAGNLQYGFLGQDIGYLRIRSFGGSGWAPDIDNILAALSATAGIIIDIRDNGGGSDLNSDVIASRFTDRRREYAQVRYRNGPRHDDFTAWFKRWLEPDGKAQFTKPVIVLTNRRTFSTSESFLLQMRALPHVRVVGDTTGGGSGNPITRELPNGWTYRVPRWQETPPDGQPYEGIGLAPHVTVWITAQDSARKKDTILETATSLIRNQDP